MSQHREQILAFAFATSMHFILIGDFNMDPATLIAAQPWSHLWGRELVILMHDVEVTCLQGSGTLDDYVVMPRSAIGVVASLMAAEGAQRWSPHTYLDLSIRRAPREVLTRVLRRPLPFPRVQECSLPNGPRGPAPCQ